ncbi:NACHT and ankyrin domain protein [Colletotrichum sojae]|uniref:NACHT and ankyrin domain protein n=1 Tax=Colletotrichum sojae TaxID=2175907 RepID=A0A8H6JR34_9PEZI|nr:NACHT and ankyrin domain protein [Colletotrichum sojae]
MEPPQERPENRPANQPKNSPEAGEYTIGWVCALPVKTTAARIFFDEAYDPPRVRGHDNNSYHVGKIDDHKVVIATLPKWEYGLSSATAAVKDMIHTYHNIRVGFMVGIGGGAPTQGRDIQLGDIVVSAPDHGVGGVLQFDYGIATQGKRYEPQGHLDQPPQSVLTAVASLESDYHLDQHDLGLKVEEKLPKISKKIRKIYERPPPGSDVLYKQGYAAMAAAAYADDLIRKLPRADVMREESLTSAIEKLEKTQADSKGSAEELERLFNLSRGGEEEPGFQELSDGFITMLEAQSLTTYIVLDALDQCTDRQGLLGLISKIAQLSSTGYVKMIATSRSDTKLMKQMGTPVGRQSFLQLDEKSFNSDIRSYLAHRVSMGRLQLDNLDQCSTLNEALDALHSFPVDLDKTYSQMVDAMRGENATRLLQAVVNSRRPLFLEEAVDMMAVSTTNGNCVIDSNSRLKVPEDILQFCPGLIKALELGTMRYLRLAHPSVADFLRRKKAEAFETGRSCYDIAKTCLVYLASVAKHKSDDIQSRFPLTKHAALYCMEYACIAQSRNHDGGSSFVNAAVELLTDENSFSIWVDPCQKSKPRGNALYYACENNLCNIVEALFEKPGIDINFQGGRPLWKLPSSFSDARI